MALTAKRLRTVLTYNPETGLFRWRKRTSNRVKIGDVAGCVSSTTGEILIRIDGVLYKAHRLAWLYVYGQWPTDEIDHWDLDRGNNRLGNLRLATKSQNNMNRRPYKGRKHKGVYRRGGRWIATIRKDGERVYLGSFHTIGAAIFIRKAATKQLHGEFARVD